MWSGLIWHGALRAYWVSLVIRLTVELQLPDIQLVLLGTVMEAALLLAEVPTGVVADAYSRKWSVVVGLAVVGAAIVMSGFVESFAALVAAQILWGVGYTFRSGAETAWITDELGGPDQVEELLLRRARLQLVVGIFSIGAGAALGRFTSLTTSIVVAGAALLATAAVSSVVMSETGFVPARLDAVGRSVVGRMVAAGASMRSVVLAGGRAATSSRSLRTLMIVLVLAGVAGEVIDRLDIRRLDNLGLSADYDEIVLVAVLAAAESALGAVVLWWGHSRLRGAQIAPGIGVILAVSAVGVLGLGFVAVVPAAMLALVGQGGLRTVVHQVWANWANAHAPTSVRATVHSFIEQISSVGEITGGIVLGAVAAATTIPTALALSAGLLVVASLVAFDGRRTWADAG